MRYFQQMLHETAFANTFATFRNLFNFFQDESTTE